MFGRAFGEAPPLTQWPSKKLVQRRNSEELEPFFYQARATKMWLLLALPHRLGTNYDKIAIGATFANRF